MENNCIKPINTEKPKFDFSKDAPLYTLDKCLSRLRDYQVQISHKRKEIVLDSMYWDQFKIDKHPYNRYVRSLEIEHEWSVSWSTLNLF